MLYQAYQAQRDFTAPARALAGLTLHTLDVLPRRVADRPLVRYLAATNEMVTRAALTHVRPAFGIATVTVDGVDVAVTEEAAATTPFGTLLHFVKDTDVEQPRVLVVAALAGHFATLLRPTVRALLPDHDVYITDWHNARDVGIEHGDFGLDEYIEHVIEFLEVVGPGAHVLAVCQPCPATLAATSIMAEAKNPATPRSLTLMAGPVDTEISPTVVNDLATSTPLSWFEDNVVTSVPLRYEGALRRVYPGFLQLSAFVWMNLDRHVDQHVALYAELAAGETADADVIKTFYDEYFAVLDMPAEFYLQTVDAVFQRHLLSRGELQWRGRTVHPAAVNRTALLTIEGERDDICGIGQTMAAHELCTSIVPSRRRHHLQAGVGHYGVFGGSKWETQIYPIVRRFILNND